MDQIGAMLIECFIDYRGCSQTSVSLVLRLIVKNEEVPSTFRQIFGHRIPYSIPAYQYVKIGFFLITSSVDKSVNL